MLNLTEEEIAALPVGIKLDALIHEFVMGHDRKNIYYTIGEIEYISVGPSGVLSYSSDISEAWKLLESFSPKDWYIQISNCCSEEDKKWCVILSENSDGEDSIMTEESGDLAESICKAALKTKAKDARCSRDKQPE